MGRYLVNRVFQSLLTLLILAVLCFVMIRLFPGGPFDEETNLAPQVIQSMNQQFSLNQPLHIQLGNFIIRLGHLDLGKSILFVGRPVSEVIAEVYFRSFALGLLALLTSLVLGFALGLLSFKIKRPLLMRLLHLFFLSSPALFLGPFLILVLGLWLGAFPVAFNGSFHSYFLPVLTLALKPAVGISRLTAASMQEVYLQPWVRVARSFGIAESVLVYKLVLRNSLLPVLAYIGTIAAGILSGSILIEMVFSVNGIGTLFIDALLNRDYQLIVGLTLLYGFLLTMATLISDILLIVIDPRLRKFSK